MKKFDYVEDYLQLIAGHIDPVTGRLVNSFYWEFKPIINLARYDVKVLESMSAQAAQNQALTAKQADLACKIILNYRRQLANKLIDVSPVENPKFRTALREMDYSQRLYIDNDEIIVRFPFNNSLIEEIREFSKSSQGTVKWNRDRKVWVSALTEYNLSWLYSWAGVHQFNVDTSVNRLFELISECEKQPYVIQLALVGDELIIKNAPESLINYIKENCGGFGIDNLLQLVDLSATLGYTLDDSIAEVVISEFGHRAFTLMTNREIKLNPNTLMSSNDFESIIQYADALERWPVVCFEPDLSGRMLEKLIKMYGQPAEWPENRYIYTTTPLKNISRIPLLISSAGMVFGGDKQLMVQRAEKIVYCAQDVYNKHNSKGKNVCKLS